MAIEFPCWNCGNVIKAADKHSGRKCKCRSCDETNTIPGQAQVSDSDPFLAEAPAESTNVQKHANNLQEPSHGKVYCYKCGASIFVEAEICPKCGVRQRQIRSVKAEIRGRDKVIAALLAFFLGLLGAHQFYLGNRTLGVIFLIFGVLGGIIVLPILLFAPFLFFVPIVCESLVAIICIVQGIIYLSMPEDEFNQRFNQQAD